MAIKEPYHTVYACDGKILKIECKEDFVINLIRANYGRYSITVCNDNGSTDWSVNCMSHRSFQILQARCNAKRNCSVLASTGLFDDPCPGTVKYLEAHFSCISAMLSSSTPRPTPPWLVTSPPSVWVTPKSFGVQPDIIIPSTSSVMSTLPPVSSTKLQPREQSESLIKIAADLCQVTETKILLEDDMSNTVNIIHDLAENMAKEIQMFPESQQQEGREADVYNLLHNIAWIGSNMLDVSQQPSWKDLSYKDQMLLATSLLINLEENSFLLADTMVKNETVTYCTKNMLLSVQVHKTKNVGNEIFPTDSVVGKCSLRINNWLKLQRSSLLENSEGEKVRLVYTAFDTLEYILRPPSNSDEVKKINSKVLSASLGKGRHIQLKQPVTLCFQHLQTENISNPTCVFWDYTQSVWSGEGCSLISTNETHTICNCNHLTNFAVLVDVKPTHSSSQVSLPLFPVFIITFVLCTLVVVVFVVRYISKHNARKDYGSTFVQDNEWSEWFSKCFGCCQSPVESEKTLNSRDPRPALYGNPTMQSMTSVDNDGSTICTTHITQPSNTIPRSYINENGGLEGHYPGSHMKLNHNYPTYNRNGSIRKIKEARRLEHLENTLQHRNKKLAGAALRSNSPRSHTYSEIAAGSSRSDPVYEEIEREREHCSQISDVSDEDAKRNSDMSRQSSKSYGDHRPLIPYNPVTDRNFHAALDAAYRQQLKEHSARMVSVLDGQSVICHLQQSEPRIYHKSVSHSPHHY